MTEERSLRKTNTQRSNTASTQVADNSERESHQNQATSNGSSKDYMMNEQILPSSE